jgi:hypothetical protein
MGLIPRSFAAALLSPAALLRLRAFLFSSLLLRS